MVREHRLRLVSAKRLLAAGAAVADAALDCGYLTSVISRGSLRRLTA
jgi:AraC-like DNA-binding protein